jgi:hypothetical protein
MKRINQAIGNLLEDWPHHQSNHSIGELKLKIKADF